MPNCYPFWGKTHIDNAAAAFMSSINALKAVSGGKQVLISETGWPTDGGTNGSAVPNEENAARYFEQIREWSLSTGTQVLYFDAAGRPERRGRCRIALGLYDDRVRAQGRICRPFVL